MRARDLSYGLVFLLLYALAGATLDRDGLALALFGNAAVLCSASLVIWTILRRRREWVGSQRLFWDTIAVGMGVWIVGHLGWAYEYIFKSNPTWLEWHTVFSLSGGAGPLLALMARPHRGVRSHAIAAVGVDIASYGLLAGFLYAYFVLVPSVTDPASAEPLLLMSVQVFRFALMTGMCCAAVFGRNTPWGATYLRLAVGVTIGAFLRIVTSGAIASGSYRIGTFYDFAWITPFLFYIWAARAAPVSSESDQVSDRPSGLSFALLAVMPVLVIPLIGYLALPLGQPDAEAASFRSLLTGLTTVVGLGLLTLRLVVQRGELQRADSRARLLAAATEQTGDLILVGRVDGSAEHANDAFLRAVGFTRRELSLLKFPQPVEHEFAGLMDSIQPELLERGMWRGTIRRRRRDGTSFPVSSTVVAIRDGSKEITHFVAVERDLTEELKLRDQLVHSERLSAVGELVAGVAHEINNPLQAIVGCVELLLEDQSEAELMRRDLESVRREAGRASHIVRNLLSFVRRNAPDRNAADLGQLVRQTAELRDSRLRQQGIRLVLQLAAEPMYVLVDREEIQQVVLNLLLNAEQALEPSSGRGGTVTVRTLRFPDRYVVEVLDDGPGIKPELRGRIFEPFFTTKEIGEGTGLGLSISHGIAGAHGGALEIVESEAGACFRLSLPVHHTAGPLRPELRDERTTVSSRALVVDDEEGIRRLLVRLLEQRGFAVAEARTLDEALVVAPALLPGVIICDVRMPGGGGLEFYRSLRTRHPDIARGFIFISGDTDLLRPAEPELSEAAILSKPFTASDLDVVLARIGPMPVVDK